jgi:hypothetical protein
MIICEGRVVISSHKRNLKSKMKSKDNKTMRD